MSATMCKGKQLDTDSALWCVKTKAIHVFRLVLCFKSLRVCWWFAICELDCMSSLHFDCTALNPDLGKSHGKVRPEAVQINNIYIYMHMYAYICKYIYKHDIMNYYVAFAGKLARPAMLLCGMAKNWSFHRNCCRKTEKKSLYCND